MKKPRTRPVLLLRALLLACALAGTAAPSLAEETGERFRARVISVADGDTVRVQRNDDGRLHILRFKGVDTPETGKGKRREPGQAFGDEAKAFTVTGLLKKEVEVEPFGTDRYGRLLSVIRVDGADFNGRLVREGLAYAFAIPGETPPAARIAEEAAAREAGKGLWGAPWRVRPSLYRRYGSLKTVEGDYRGAEATLRDAPFPYLVVAPAEGPGALTPEEVRGRIVRAGLRHLGVDVTYRDAAGARWFGMPVVERPVVEPPLRVHAMPGGGMAGILGATPPARERLEAFLATKNRRPLAGEYRIEWVDPSRMEMGWANLPADERLQELLVPLAE